MGPWDTGSGMSHDPAEQFNAALTNELDAFREGDIADDIFILTIQVR